MENTDENSMPMLLANLARKNYKKECEDKRALRIAALKEKLEKERVSK